MSVSEDSSSFCELSLVPPEIPSDDNTNVYVNDLGNCLTEFLNIQNKQKSTSATSVNIPSLNDSPIVNATKVVECNDTHEIESAKDVEHKDTNESELAKVTNEKCLSKCATFPCSVKSGGSADIFDVEGGLKGDLTPCSAVENGHTQSAIRPYPRSISLPTPLKLVSAMKGSREKEGAPPRKLSVTWAADVYDPIPTSVSHVPSSKPQRYRSDYKRNGKNKQKGGGKGSRGGRGKDKKQSRKGSGSSNKSFKPVNSEFNGACSSGPSASTLDFDVGSPDPFCGHSFLKKSVTPMHYPVAEAT